MPGLASGQTAVLVHDNVLRLARLERTLHELGIQVVARTARFDEAVSVVARSRADLVILGVDDASERDSLALLREVRDGVPGARAIALAETTDVERVDAVLEAGADVCVIETRDHAERTAAVHQALGWVAAISARRERALAGV